MIHIIKKVKDQLTAKTSSNNNESIVASGIKNEPMDQQSDEFKSSNTDHLIEKPNESDNNTENSNTNKSLDKDAFSADIDMTLRDETLHQDDATIVDIIAKCYSNISNKYCRMVSGCF